MIKRKTMAIRFDDPKLYDMVNALAAEYGYSLNQAAQMLLGYAFNEIEKQHKKFVPVKVFESK